MAAQITVRNKLNGDITTVSEKVLNNSRLSEVLEVVECETGPKVVIESGVSETPETHEAYDIPLIDYAPYDNQEVDLG